MAYDTEKKVALDVALAAAHLCDRVRQEIVPESIEKDDRSPVTVADFGSQAVICQGLGVAFPQDPIVGEEDSADLRSPERAPQLQLVTRYVQGTLPTATPDTVVQWIDRGNAQGGDRFWTLDPIDGTKGFLRGDQYAVALALVEGGEVKVGVLACPALSFGSGEPGLVFVAVRGEGASWMPLKGGDPQPLQVVTGAEADGFRFVESVESGHGDQTRQSAIAQAVGITQASIRMDSQAKYAAVAAGQAALYLRLPSPKTPDYREKIWDHAAGVLIIEEAGGRVTDMLGQPLDFSQGSKLVNNQGVVASNGVIHETVIAALQQG
ncbi:3'(2'),5'-bisphosphate nucleotidase [Prochlorothrix hollandica]|uniref:3'-5'-bisphosphate nucleotidase n=1 Tax=Prochlorothrix hollandica PCC 9006 = CALU 1027 TaxID=317619 RepID=A0A0M2PT90_PROHO|nr:3'(2'),5'-bisphosphate nucleotidase [Prochlorothrix hollandica]KKI99755.1 3'-5'-bisphosphate nucleotidase [Prochlorothrix hollandica PCC 9006 = CALU 1027]